MGKELGPFCLRRGRDPWDAEQGSGGRRLYPAQRGSPVHSVFGGEGAGCGVSYWPGDPLSEGAVGGEILAVCDHLLPGVC